METGEEESRNNSAALEPATSSPQGTHVITCLSSSAELNSQQMGDVD